MTFGQSISTCFRKYADFSGRASRSEFWWFILFSYLTYFIVGVILSLLLPPTSTHNDLIYNIVWLLFLLPTLTVTSRRLHDINKSGAWLFFYFTGIGVILLYIWALYDTRPEDNEYGPPAK